MVKTVPYPMDETVFIPVRPIHEIEKSSYDFYSAVVLWT